MSPEPQQQSFDIAVVGSGIAGLFYALKVAEHGSVAILTKKQLSESNTNYAQGGIACVTSEEDTFDLHLQDTLRAGAGLCRGEVVREIVAEGPERLQELIHLNVPFSERRDAPGYDLGKEGGHTKRRILHVGDVTGREIENALVEAVRAHPNIAIFENYVAVDLITSHKIKLGDPNRCLGLYALDAGANLVHTIRASAVVLATGGCGKVYLYTTNPSIATGDGVAIAYRAGVPIANMEFVQFHPTCLYHPLERSFLISEAMRGEGARLVDSRGRAFMEAYDERADLASRDIVARAIDSEMKRTGAECAFLDITHKSRDFLRQRFPNIYTRCEELGIDIATQPIPIVPAAHYQCGGIVTDLHGATALPGLYAIGEVACTGLHGANRLASNSLLEAVVMAHRTAHRTAKDLSGLSHQRDLPPWHEGDAHDPDEAVVITHNWREIRQLMWDYVGIVRTNKRLQRALKRLQLLMREIHQYYWDFRITADLLELRNLALVSDIIVESALQRKESRGLHYTADYPETQQEARDTLLKL